MHCSLLLVMQTVQQNALKGVPVVDISGSGIFKYILISCMGNSKGAGIAEHFVRGYSELDYHMQNFQKFVREIKKAGFDIAKKKPNQGTFQAVRGELRLKFACRGGGRIEHNYEGKKCFIYGYSQSYGSVDHTIAQKLISAALNYPLNQITTSQEGY